MSLTNDWDIQKFGNSALYVINKNHLPGPL